MNDAWQNEFKQRRQRLFAHMQPGDIAILPAAPHLLRSRDLHLPYYPNKDFYYLTGFIEPNAVVILTVDEQAQQFIIFNRSSDPMKTLWDGPLAGQEGVITDYGADQAYAIEQLDELMPRLLEDKQRVFYNFDVDQKIDKKLLSWIKQLSALTRRGVRSPEHIIHLSSLLYELRLLKSPMEIETMRQAGNISALAICRAMRHCKPGQYEYHIEAELLHEYLQHGARCFAYEPIVGSGGNTCTIHYVANAAKMHDGDLLLIDAGCEYQQYCADITRTFPVNGKFTAEQRAIYEVVLAAQLAGIEQARPDIAWNKVHDATVKVITEGLVDLGILRGDIADLIATKAYQRFYVHYSGHWLGLDTHDVGKYKIEGQWRPLEPDMVFTVEPGIYIPAGTEDVDEKWWDIGIRIEDDIVVTEGEPEVLSADVPKHIDEIEALMHE